MTLFYLNHVTIDATLVNLEFITMTTSDNRDLIEKLMGASTYIFNDEKEENQKFHFFSPYQSKSDFGFRVASVVTAPIVWSVADLFLLFYAGKELLQTFSKILDKDFSGAKKNFSEAGIHLLIIQPLILISALTSPLINLIDLIGGAIASTKQLFAESAPSPKNS